MSAECTSDAARRAQASRPRETFVRAVQLLSDHDMLGFANLWAQDGTMDFPFAVGDQPRHLEGREAVVEYLRHYTDMVDVRDSVVHVIHDTADPDTIVVEWESSGVVVATARPYRMPYVAVITVGAEGIVSYRDYWSVAAVTDAMTSEDQSSVGESA